MRSALDTAVLSLITQHGWTPGTSLENRVAMHMHRFGLRPGDLIQQLRVDRFRIDFAAPDIQIAIEADGWHHRSPEGSARDSVRDSQLRLRGWVVLRVDDRFGPDALKEQVSRAIRIVRAEWGRDRPLRPASRQAKSTWGQHGPIDASSN